MIFINHLIDFSDLYKKLINFVIFSIIIIIKLIIILIKLSMFIILILYPLFIVVNLFFDSINSYNYQQYLHFIY